MASFRKKGADVGSDGPGVNCETKPIAAARRSEGVSVRLRWNHPWIPKAPVDQVHVAMWRNGRDISLRGLGRRSCGERRRNLGFPDRPG